MSHPGRKLRGSPHFRSLQNVNKGAIDYIAYTIYYIVYSWTTKEINQNPMKHKKNAYNCFIVCVFSFQTFFFSVHMGSRKKSSFPNGAFFKKILLLFDILLKTTYQNINTGNVGKVVVF